MGKGFDAPFRAVAFDMDGTLLDSMPYWRRMNTDFLKARGLTPPEEVRADLSGTSNRVCAKLFANTFDLGMTMEDILAEYRAGMRRYYLTQIQPKPGAIAYVRALRARGVKTAVATASSMDLALLALNRHGMLGDFDFVVSAFDLHMKKEEPHFYRLVAEKFGERPEDCAMVEDALYAMQGARAAGMTVLGVGEAVQERDREEIIAFCDGFTDRLDLL